MSGEAPVPPIAEDGGDAGVVDSQAVALAPAPVLEVASTQAAKQFVGSAEAAGVVAAMWRSRVSRVDTAERLEITDAAASSTKLEEERKLRLKMTVPTPLGVLALVFGDVPTLLGVLAVGAVQAVSMIGLAVTFSYFFDDLTTYTSNGRYAVFEFETLLLLGVLGAVQGLAAFSKSLLVDLGGNNLAVRLRVRLVKAVCGCTLDWFDSRRSPEAIFHAMEEEVEKLGKDFYKETFECFWDGLSAVTALLGMALISVGVTVSVVFAIPPLAILDAAFSTALERFNERYVAREADSDKEALDLLKRLRLIREHNMLMPELNDFLLASKDTKRFYTYVALARATYQFLLIVFASAFLCLVLYFEGKLAEDGKVSVGTALACLILAIFAQHYLNCLLEGLPKVVSGYGVAKSLKTLVNEAELAELAPGDEHIEIAQKQKRGAAAASRKVNPDPSKAALQASHKRLRKMHGKEEEAEPGTVEFIGVVFAYPHALGDVLLRGFNAKLLPGEITVLISNKGTSARAAGMLLLRHQEPRKGCVNLDGEDVASLDTRDLRKRTFSLSDEVMIFRGTIAENVLYGQAVEEARDEAAEQASLASCLEYAGLDRFVNGLEHGAQSVLKGTDGNESDETAFHLALSVNQRRRLQLARLFFRNPVFVVVDRFLDEALLKASGTATQNFNAEASSMRSAYRRALRQPFHRTVLVCAHTADEVFSADHGIFITDGKPVENGKISTLEQNPSSMMKEFVNHEEEAAIRWGFK